jgi:hypothetical protein
LTLDVVAELELFPITPRIEPIEPPVEIRSLTFVRSGFSSSLSEELARLRRERELERALELQAEREAHLVGLERTVADCARRFLDRFNGPECVEDYNPEAVVRIHAEMTPAIVACFSLTPNDKVNALALAVCKLWLAHNGCKAFTFNLFHEYVWKMLAENVDFEERMPHYNPNYSVGLLRGHSERCGIHLHFTTRTDREDAEPCISALATLISTINDLGSPQSGETKLFHCLKANLARLTQSAIERYARSVEKPHLAVGADRIGSDIASATNDPELRAWATAALRRWRTQLFASGEALIHVMIDRAALPKAFGGVGYDGDAKPAAFMSGALLRRMPTVRVNLDATGHDEMMVTLAHEIAHALGCNPTGCEASGHLAAPSGYRTTDGATHIPKMLFDAYFFEALVAFANQGS